MIGFYRAESSVKAKESISKKKGEPQKKQKYDSEIPNSSDNKKPARQTNNYCLSRWLLMT